MVCRLHDPLACQAAFCWSLIDMRWQRNPSFGLHLGPQGVKQLEKSAQYRIASSGPERFLKLSKILVLVLPSASIVF